MTLNLNKQLVICLRLFFFSSLDLFTFSCGFQEKKMRLIVRKRQMENKTIRTGTQFT